VALGLGLVSSAAALGIAGASDTGPSLAGQDQYTYAARAREAARAEQRARIDERYAAEREACSALRGFQRDKCFVKAHANRGRAMLEAAAPYEGRH
jgi:hypothetical protein